MPQPLQSFATAARKLLEILQVQTVQPRPRRLLGWWPSWPHHIGDVVFGANDGIITTFAVVSGVAGAALSAKTTLILGLANLCAGGLAMGAGNYLGMRSQQDYRRSAGAVVREGRLHALGHGGAIFLAFVLAGSIPLVPFVLLADGTRFAVSCASTAVMLFAVGSLRTLVTQARWFSSGLEMLGVGSAAAAVAYGVGHWLQRLS